MPTSLRRSPVSSARAAWAVSPLFLRPRSAVDGDGPTVPARFSHPSIRARQGRAITAAYADDPASAAAEYGAQFRTDVETFVSREVVEACLIPGRHELPPRRDGLHRAFATRPVAAGVIPSREPSPTWRSARGAGSPSSPGSPEPDPGLLRRLGRAVGSPPDFPGRRRLGRFSLSWKVAPPAEGADLYEIFCTIVKFSAQLCDGSCNLGGAHR